MSKRESKNRQNSSANDKVTIALLKQINNINEKEIFDYFLMI